MRDEIWRKSRDERRGWIRVEAWRGQYLLYWLERREVTKDGRDCWQCQGRRTSTRDGGGSFSSSDGERSCIVEDVRVKESGSGQETRYGQTNPPIISRSLVDTWKVGTAWMKYNSPNQCQCRRSIHAGMKDNSTSQRQRRWSTDIQARHNWLGV